MYIVVWYNYIRMYCIEKKEMIILSLGLRIFALLVVVMIVVLGSHCR